MSNGTIQYQDFEGQIIPKSFAPGYVALSYLVSYVGAWTTLELFYRRTAGRGTYNWFLLIASAISMGGVAIWCMHYIANLAIVLGNGDIVLQIVYSPIYTALSFFVPIFVLLAAFMAIGSDASAGLLRVSLGGTLAGLAICGVHYLGQAGIANYYCVYKVENVVGAAVVAIAASIWAFAVFFIFRSMWTNHWWERALTAFILSGAVSGMHWLASVGTDYQLRRVEESPSARISRTATIIVIIVLSTASCLVLFALSILATRRRTRSANRAQQVVLAAAIFDEEGRLMVTPEGLIPNQKITNSFLGRSFDDTFCISHPVFLWLYRTTRDWRSAIPLLPLMRSHVSRTLAMHKNAHIGSIRQVMSKVDFSDENGDPIEDYSIIFRELFCVAAADLAERLSLPLQSLGILFDEIISTGEKPMFRTSRFSSRRTTLISSLDLERYGNVLPRLGLGQLLFLVKRANRHESEHLLASGYRFATPSHVAPTLAHNIQISRNDLMQHLDRMKDFAGEEKILDPGVHLCLFAMRASVGSFGINGRTGGFDILVRKEAKALLPSAQLPFQALENWHTDFLAQVDSTPVPLVLEFLRHKIDVASASPVELPAYLKREVSFATQFLETLEALAADISDPAFNDSLLKLQPVQAPCRGLLGDDTAAPGRATLLAFSLMVPIHSPALGTAGKFEFTPMSFFRMQQTVYKNSPEHDIFARRTHREFGPILSNKGRSPSSSDARTVKSISRNSPSNFGLSSKEADCGTKKEAIVMQREINLAMYPPTLFPSPRLSRENREKSKSMSQRKFLSVRRPNGGSAATDGGDTMSISTYNSNNNIAEKKRNDSRLRISEDFRSRLSDNAEPLAMSKPSPHPPSPPAYDSHGGGPFQELNLELGQANQAFGGILVSQEVKVEINNLEKPASEVSTNKTPSLRSSSSSRDSSDAGPPDGGRGGGGMVELAKVGSIRGRRAASVDRRRGRSMSKGGCSMIRASSSVRDRPRERRRSEALPMGTVGRAECEGEDSEVFVDELFVICVEGREGRP